MLNEALRMEGRLVHSHVPLLAAGQMTVPTREDHGVTVDSATRLATAAVVIATNADGTMIANCPKTLAWRKEGSEFSPAQTYSFQN